MNKKNTQQKNSTISYMNKKIHNKQIQRFRI